ncbi:MFS general substrate transporter [Thozetella sp. PMI_491]|nr:MFS general substrate transporter [Thozetella sp. PMI_491]
MTSSSDAKVPAAAELEDAPVKGLPLAEGKKSHAEGDALLVDKHGNVRRLPVPSADPNDPLNFRTWEKWVVIGCCCWYSIMGLALAGGLGAILGVFFQIYIPQGYTSDQVVLLLTVPSLCIGLGNWLILPLSLAFGRRPVFLCAVVALLASTIGAATQDSYEGHLIARIFQGLSTGASESLLPLMLTEVTFLHERGRIFGLYWMSQNIISSLLNLASSYEAAALGWRSYYYVFVGTIAVGLIFTILGGFETRFSRPAASLDGQVVITDDFGVTHIVPDDQAQEFLDRMQVEEVVIATERKPYLEKLRPWSEPHAKPWSMIVMSWVYMIESVTSPAILWVILLTSITLACSIDMSLTYDQVLQGYGWQAQDIGLINLGGVVGGILGTAYCTFLGDPFVIWMARRNSGLHRPEHRLLVLIPLAFLGVAMLLLYGFASAGNFPNSWATVMSWTLFQVTFTGVLIVSTTFAAEASPKHPGPALVMVVGTKNIISFGATYGFTPLVERGGTVWAFGVLTAIFGAVCILGVAVYLLNPMWRRHNTRREQKRGLTTTD